MSLNDPHIEAQMELETRYPQHADQPPRDFGRRVALVAAVIVGILGLVWLLTFLLH